ncbi:FadR/GntR family transcriptional regulator [uncultured Rummeliibacillus sp.]|uniref:FadR/GntR family transcriptional regulator n=1 Tax=uncultured Rummeliibacillus sp. TaxID=762292 RepID=UPI00261FB1EE|nr:FadR/GntR family transcriptional regulator [uncultured Rummeliibacillus sp.]
MQYKKIKAKKIYEEVAEALHEMIRTGVLQPGDRLDSVQQLSENFQVSRSAIREALSALKAMGLVDIKQGEGTFVKSFDANQIVFPLSTAILMNKEDISDLLEVRKIIEVGTVTAAARNRTKEDLNKMREILEEMKESPFNEELGEKVDFEFHTAISLASHNPLLSIFLEQVSGLMFETMKETRRIWLYSKQTTREKLFDEHMKIYEAIEQQDETKSKQAMLWHLENVENILIKYFKETNIMKKE